MPNYMTELSPDNNSHVYQIKDKEAAPIDLLKDTVGWVGKNRLPITLDILKRDNTTGTWSGNTYTKNGVTFTFTFDEDGYLAKANINGTNSVSEQFSVVFNSALPIKASSYVFNGCPNGGGYSSYWIQWRNITDSSNIGDDTGNGIDYTFTADKTCLFRVYIAANATVSNKDFYPMLRDASIIDSTFEPFHPSVEQTLRDAEVIKGKNLLPNEGISQTISGVTFTKYEDGTVKANGTATARVNYQWLTNETAEKILTPFIGQTLRLSGSRDGAVPDKYWLTIQSMFGDGNGANQQSNTLEFTVVDFRNFVNRPWGYIAIPSGATVNNVIFKPMLTLASETDSGYDNYEPFYIPLKDSKFDRAEQRVLGAWNLLKVKLSDVKALNTSGTWSGNTYTKLGIAFAVTTNASGYVTEVDINGTNDGTNQSELTLTTNVGLENGRYILNGGISSNKRMYFYDGTRWYDDMGDGVEFLLQNPSRQQTSIVVTKNQSASHEKFYPMISTNGGKYAPPTMTNRELTELATAQESACTDIISGATVSEGQGGNHLYKKSGVVQMILGLEGVTVGAFSTFAKVPDGYKPIATMITNTFRTTGNQIYIAPNGNIQCASALNNANINIVATWITS